MRIKCDLETVTDPEAAKAFSAMTDVENLHRLLYRQFLERHRHGHIDTSNNAVYKTANDDNKIVVITIIIL